MGLFMCFHLFTNMQIGVGDFQHEVDWIHSQPAVLFAEIGLIWLPLAFHASLGIYYGFVGNKQNLKNYRYGGNIRYMLQRYTGMIALVFIFFHIATLRWRWTLGADTPFFSHALIADGNDGKVIPFATQATAIAVQASAIITLLYIVGALASVYHFANGLWTAAITWGLTITAAGQKRWGAVCAMIFLTLTMFSVIAIYSAATYDLSEDELAAYQTTKELYREHDHKLLHEADLISASATVVDGKIEVRGDH